MEDDGKKMCGRTPWASISSLQPCRICLGRRASHMMYVKYEIK